MIYKTPNDTQEADRKQSCAAFYRTRLWEDSVNAQAVDLKQLGKTFSYSVIKSEGLLLYYTMKLKRQRFFSWGYKNA